MKKLILILLILFTSMVSTCFAYRVSYEPTSENSVAYSSYGLIGNILEATFVKSVSSDDNAEYWLRLSTRATQTNLIYPLFLTIDGIEYQLTPILEPTAKHFYAGESLIDNSSTGLGGIIPRSSSRYWNIDNDIIENFRKDSKISITYNTVTYANITVKIPSEFIEKAQHVFGLKYGDLNTYWSPKDQSKK